MKPARCYVGDMMTGFILVSALQHKDEVDELIDKDERWLDLVINTSDISIVYEDEHAERTYITLMSTDKEITTKNTLDEIIQKIRRATSINIYSQ
jgi:hypothetical protein